MGGVQGEGTLGAYLTKNRHLSSSRERVSHCPFKMKHKKLIFITIHISFYRLPHKPPGQSNHGLRLVAIKDTVSDSSS